MEVSGRGVQVGMVRMAAACVTAALWVNGHTQGTTNIKGPGRSDTVIFFNSTMRDRQVIGAYNGGAYRVQGLTHIDPTKTYGYCSDS